MAKVLLILPCNAGACVGDYFRPGSAWALAAARLADLRKEGRVTFAAVDSCVLETQPEDPRGAIVLETEMERVVNPTGEDWGAPSWRWFRPTKAGRWPYLEELTDALMQGIGRVEGLKYFQVLAVVNPRGYFLALAAAAARCKVLDRWLLFRPPAHPRHLVHGVSAVLPFVHAAAGGKRLRGGLYCIPGLYPHLAAESRRYRHRLVEPWRSLGALPGTRQVARRWKLLYGKE